MIVCGVVAVMYVTDPGGFVADVNSVRSGPAEWTILRSPGMSADFCRLYENRFSEPGMSFCRAADEF